MVSIDDCSRVTLVYLLKQKSEVTSVFLDFFAIVKTQFRVISKITLITSLILFVKKKVLFMSLHVSKPPNKMGFLREKKGHLLDQTRAMLF